MSQGAHLHESLPARRPRQLASGSPIYRAGETGQAWRLQQGVVRLDNLGRDGEWQFASLAIRHMERIKE